jgi:hypothetical protein
LVLPCLFRSSRTYGRQLILLITVNKDTTINQLLLPLRDYSWKQIPFQPCQVACHQQSTLSLRARRQHLSTRGAIVSKEVDACGSDVYFEVKYQTSGISLDRSNSVNSMTPQDQCTIRDNEYEPGSCNTYIGMMIKYFKQTRIEYSHKIKSNIIYFNCACATLICLNQNKQNGSHNTPLRELGRDQFNKLHFLRPRIRIKYKSLLVLVTMLR